MKKKKTVELTTFVERGKDHPEGPGLTEVTTFVPETKAPKGKTKK